MLASQFLRASEEIVNCCRHAVEFSALRPSFFNDGRLPFALHARRRHESVTESLVHGNIGSRKLTPRNYSMAQLCGWEYLKVSTDCRAHFGGYRSLLE